MTDPPADGPTTIEWHRQEGDRQLLVSVEGGSVQIAVALGPATPRSAVVDAWDELLREFDHHAGADGSPVHVRG